MYIRRENITFPKHFSKRHKFSNVLTIVPLHSKCSVTLSFENANKANLAKMGSSASSLVSKVCMCMCVRVSTYVHMNVRVRASVVIPVLY